jgi:hypothetical protein
MKKSSKPIKSPAPATRTPAPLPKLATKPATKTRVEPIAAAKPAAPAVPASRIAPAPAAPRAVAASLTVINAKVDVGFGNSLFVRGEGPGLSWNQGLAMSNVTSALWTISLPRSSRPVTFKFLVNDEIWSSGEDYQADPGIELTLSPSF